MANNLKQYEYYRTKNGVLYCADCLTIMPQLGPVDFVLTDPPYGMDAVKNSGVLKERYRDVIGDDTNKTAIDAVNLFMSMNIKKMVFWGANYYTECLPSTGCWLVWDKNNGGSDQTDAGLYGQTSMVLCGNIHRHRRKRIEYIQHRSQ